MYNPKKGFLNKRDSRSEITLINGWAVGIAQQSKPSGDQEVSRKKSIANICSNFSQDYAIVVDNYAGEALNDLHTRVLFGIYDGHNGQTASDFVSATFAKVLS